MVINEVTAPSLGLAWKDLLALIYKKGSKVMDGDTELLELCHVIVSLPSDFAIEDKIFETLFDKSLVKFMRNNFFGKEPFADWGYSYSQRLENYHGIRQLERTVQKLRNNPESKSATICLADPVGDQHHVPCIYSLDFKLRNGELDITAYFRSQDAGKKFCADIYCLKEIQNNIAKELMCKTGKIFLLSSSMHIYKQDYKKAEEVLDFKP